MEMNGRGKYEQLALECENYLKKAIAELFLAKCCAQELGGLLGSKIDHVAGKVNDYIDISYQLRCLAAKIERGED